jgi:hypothetical protein
MVCLELGAVIGCFHRDRDRQQAYPPPLKARVGSESFKRVRSFLPAGVGVMADLQESGIAPGEK